MFRTMLKSRIHRATVTETDSPDAGSVIVDGDLLDAADLLEGERVTLVDVTSGTRLEAYVLAGEPGSGVLGVNGAAARSMDPGDLVILVAYAVLEEGETRGFRPRVIFVDGENRIVARGSDPGTAPEDAGLVSRAEISVETDDAARLDALLQQPER